MTLSYFRSWQLHSLIDDLKTFQHSLLQTPTYWCRLTLTYRRFLHRTYGCHYNIPSSSGNLLICGNSTRFSALSFLERRLKRVYTAIEQKKKKKRQLWKWLGRHANCRFSSWYCVAYSTVLWTCIGCAVCCKVLHTSLFLLRTECFRLQIYVILRFWK